MNHKSIGQRDRQLISDKVFNLTRYKELLDAISERPLTWESRYNQLYTDRFRESLKNQNIDYHIRCSTKKELYDLISD